MFTLELNSYRHGWIVRAIEREVMKLGMLITDSTQLEERIHQKIGTYLEGNPERVSNRRYIIQMVRREIDDGLKERRFKTEKAIHISGIEMFDSDGQAVEFEPKDNLAVVGSDMLEIRETINLLAKGDRRKKLILNEWMQGNTNDSDISRTLARELGGKVNTYRISIQRFRIECREALTALENVCAVKTA